MVKESIWVQNTKVVDTMVKESIWVQNTKVVDTMVESIWVQNTKVVDTMVAHIRALTPNSWILGRWKVQQKVIE